MASIDYSRVDPRFLETYQEAFEGKGSSSIPLAYVLLSEFNKGNDYAVEQIIKHRPEILYERTCGLSYELAFYANPVSRHLPNIIKEKKADPAPLIKVVSALPRDQQGKAMLHFAYFLSDVEMMKQAVELGFDKKLIPPDYELSGEIGQLLRDYRESQ